MTKIESLKWALKLIEEALEERGKRATAALFEQHRRTVQEIAMLESEEASSKAGEPMTRQLRIAAADGEVV